MCPGASGALGAFQGLLEAAERAVTRVMSSQVGLMLAQGKTLPWLPDIAPPNTNNSPYIEELLMYLKVLLTPAKQSHLRGSLGAALGAGSGMTAVNPKPATPQHQTHLPSCPLGPPQALNRMGPL